MCQGKSQLKFQRHKCLKYSTNLLNTNQFNSECQKQEFILSSKVHKIFALYPLNQSQLHKRYPPIEIETGNDDEKWCFPKDSAQADRSYNHGIGMIGIHLLILCNVLWFVCNTPMAGYFPSVSYFSFAKHKSKKMIHHYATIQRYWKHTARILLWGIKERRNLYLIFGSHW